MAIRGEFSSRIGFVLAAAGSAVGLGNIWGSRRRWQAMAVPLCISLPFTRLRIGLSSINGRTHHRAKFSR